MARAHQGRTPSLPSATAAVLALFAGTLFLSAFLLFSVQPIFAKMVLPTLGGSPSVWAVSMCFFQAVLLAGYCYAHALNRWLSMRAAAIVHVIVLGLALLALPFGLPQGIEPPVGDAYLWLVGALALGVGLPFFAVSANAPMLQAWFARSGHPHAADPYFLYGASNLGSLIALLAYPFVLEPALGLAAQAVVWTGGFAVLTALIACCAGSPRLAAVDAAGSPEAPGATAAEPVGLADRLGWIGLSFVPSGLLVAFSSFVTTDIASAPFMWVVPLALFLATFILVFCERPPIPHALLLMLQPVLVGATLFGLALAGNNGWYLSTIGGFAAFFVTTMVCHRELYLARPAPRHLTEFYLWMSLGGVLGGIFAAIIAPQVFNTLFEYPLLLLAGIACRPSLAARLRDIGEQRKALLFAAIGAIVIGLVVMLSASGLLGFTTLFNLSLAVMVAGIVLMMLLREEPAPQLACAAAVAVALAVLPTAYASGISERSFFGVHRITETPDGQARMLLHGTTVHGIERLKHADGRAVDKPVPASYYHPAGPMARGVEIARAAKSSPAPLNAAVVGLGAGSMACHAHAGETWRFFEIDPVVVRIARDPRRFRFIQTCQPDMAVVLGDARLTLGREPAGLLDYLVVDAFSSNAIPVHLLTREAMQLYLDKLAPSGLLALHISNRHLELVGVASAVAASIPGAYAMYVQDARNGTLDVAGSQVLFVSRSAATIARVQVLAGAVPVHATTADGAAARAWTDDYSDVISALWRKMSHH